MDATIQGSGGRLARTLVEVTRLYLLGVAALGTGEGAYLAGAEGGDDGGLVPVEDVAALLALLPEGHDRAPLGHDLTPRHLYRHATVPPANPGAIVPEIERRRRPSPLEKNSIDLTTQLVVS